MRILPSINSTMTPVRHKNVAVLVGRSAALCAHPYAAWRLHPGATRVLLVSAYATAAYIVVLSALMML